MPSTYDRACGQFAVVHEVLRRNFRRIAEVARGEHAVARGDFAGFVQLNLRMLTLHHEGEDEIIFPALRAASRLRSTDVAFLEAQTAEHVEVQRCIRTLEREATALRTSGGPGALDRIGHSVTTLSEILWPHLASEDAALTPRHVADMIDETALGRMIVDVVKHEKARGGPLGLMLVATSLTEGERRDLFSEIPWPVRKVLVRHVWRRSYRPYLPFAVQPDMQGL